VVHQPADAKNQATPVVFHGRVEHVRNRLGRGAFNEVVDLGRVVVERANRRIQQKRRFELLGVGFGHVGDGGHARGDIALVQGDAHIRSNVAAADNADSHGVHLQSRLPLSVTRGNCGNQDAVANSNVNRE
jgi:hypothetical protein